MLVSLIILLLASLSMFTTTQSFICLSTHSFIHLPVHSLTHLSVHLCGTNAFTTTILIQEVNLTLHKFDELDCLIQGVHFIYRHNPQMECYYFANPLGPPENCEVKHFDFSDPYPYLIVNVGSGVSMLTVRSPTEYKRVCGTR